MLTGLVTGSVVFLSLQLGFPQQLVCLNVNFLQLNKDAAPPPPPGFPLAASSTSSKKLRHLYCFSFTLTHNAAHKCFFLLLPHLEKSSIPL